MNALKQVIILLVEDDPGDQKLISKSMAAQKIANYLYTVQSGEEALEYLQRSKEGDEQCPRPDLILLDLNMPGMGGKEFLRQIKDDEDFDTIPVVILTTSDSDRDVMESYKLHAAGYVKKPVDLEGLIAAMKEVNSYWFLVCKRVCQELHELETVKYPVG